MQEEVENKTVMLAVSTSKMTASVLKSALSKCLAYQKERARDKKLAKARDGPVIPHGKQKLKDLVMQNQGVSSIEITDKNIKDFERVARKYGVDYALKKDSYTKPPRYLVFFKARDADGSQRRSRNIPPRPTVSENSRLYLHSSVSLKRRYWGVTSLRNARRSTEQGETGKH